MCGGFLLRKAIVETYETATKLLGVIASHASRSNTLPLQFTLGSPATARGP